MTTPRTLQDPYAMGAEEKAELEAREAKRRQDREKTRLKARENALKERRRRLATMPEGASKAKALRELEHDERELKVGAAAGVAPQAQDSEWTKERRRLRMEVMADLGDEEEAEDGLSLLEKMRKDRAAAAAAAAAAIKETEQEEEHDEEEEVEKTKVKAKMKTEIEVKEEAAGKRRADIMAKISQNRGDGDEDEGCLPWLRLHACPPPKLYPYAVLLLT